MTVTKKSKPTPRKRTASPSRTVNVTEARRRDNVARASGGPLDSALYKCDCGSEFTAAVTTSVLCPQCGTGQAW